MIANDGVPIPLSRRRICTYCAVTIDSNARGVFQRASGWLENRKGGGANTIAIPIRTDAWACNECIDRLRHGIAPAQSTLFDRHEYE